MDAYQTDLTWDQVVSVIEEAFPNQVDFTYKANDEETDDDARDWCEERFGKPARSLNYMYQPGREDIFTVDLEHDWEQIGITFYFKHHYQAIEFKLRWYRR